jgi:hypothetical protein
MALRITLDSSNELLVRVTGVLANIIFTTTSGDRDSFEPPPWPPLIAFDTPLCSLLGGYSWRSLSSAQGYLFTVLHEDGPDRLLARGEPGGIIEELLHGLWLFKTELVH